MVSALCLFILSQVDSNKKLCEVKVQKTIISVIYINVVIGRMIWAGHVACLVGTRGVCMVLVRKPEGKRQLGRHRRRLEDNIKMDLQELGCGSVDWIGLAQDRDRWRALVKAVMNLGVP